MLGLLELYKLLEYILNNTIYAGNRRLVIKRNLAGVNLLYICIDYINSRL